jgi:hypothetical protein
LRNEIMVQRFPKSVRASFTRIPKGK